MTKKKVPSVKEIYQRASKNVLKPNTIFTEDIWHARLIGRRLATYFTWIFLHTEISPNSVTILAMFIGCLGSILFFIPTITSLLTGFVIFELYLILDSSDGELARFTGKTSSLGNYLDTIGHVLIYSCLYIALGINVYLRTSNRVYIIVGLLTALAYAVASAVHHLDPLLEKNTYLELRKKENRLLFCAKNTYNFITEDLNVAYAIVLFGILQYTGTVQQDLLATLLIINLALLVFGGIFFNITTKLFDRRYYGK